MRFLMSFVRIGVSLVVLALLWAVLFGQDALRLHFVTPAYAAPAPGHHPYHFSDAIIYVSDGELLFLRVFTYGLPLVVVFLAMWVFSEIDKRPVARRSSAFAPDE